MEGDKFSGKTNSRPVCVCSEWKTKCNFRFFDQRFFLVIGCLFCQSRPLFSPPWYFPLSHSVLFADCMFSLGFWSSELCRTFVQQLGGVSVSVCLVDVAFAGFSLSVCAHRLLPPHSHRFQLKVFVIRGCRSVTSSFPIPSPSA